MSDDVVGGGSQRSQRVELAESERSVHDQSHAEAQPVASYDEVADDACVSELQIERVIVISVSILSCKERFTRILRGHKPQLDALPVIEAVA